MGADVDLAAALKAVGDDVGALTQAVHAVRVQARRDADRAVAAANAAADAAKAAAEAVLAVKQKQRRLTMIARLLVVLVLGLGALGWQNHLAQQATAKRGRENQQILLGVGQSLAILEGATGPASQAKQAETLRQAEQQIIDGVAGLLGRPAPTTTTTTTTTP